MYSIIIFLQLTKYKSTFIWQKVDPIYYLIRFIEYVLTSFVVQKEYKDLAEQLSEYTVKLLDRVRTQQELEIILNKAGKPRFNHFESLARFKLALFYKEKKVYVKVELFTVLWDS